MKFSSPGRFVMLGLLTALGGMHLLPTPAAAPVPDFSLLGGAELRPPFNPRRGAPSPYQRRFVKGKICPRRFKELGKFAGHPYVKGPENLYRPAILNRAARRALAQGA